MSLRHRHPKVGTEVDYHQLDTCDCGARYDHFKTYVGKGEYVARWTCPKCGDDDMYMEDIEGNAL